MMKVILRLIGVTFIAIGIYYGYKSGYHLVNYGITSGLEPGTFSQGRPYWEIVVEFVLWLAVISTGVGLINSTRIGLKTAIYSLILPTLIAGLFFVAELSKKSNYSTTMMVNTERREMNLVEQWKYIYSEPTYLAILTIVLIAIFLLTNKQLKLVKT
ncbi:hypothetical protein [Reichenbachiella agariperforans]|uniref:hypothetical protein n=1 Tax=Reichenbachiella agariperforans TaxID=156994 RepID=UPI001C08B7DD|nr:hypothetical protein [Reichenbachiella agariperforans]MBU2914858.1 hypothetical protein [Reichenbachiella agariperforans]